VLGRAGGGSGEKVGNELRDDAGNGGWQKGVGGGGRRYKGLPLCSFYLLFEMARRERKRWSGGRKG